jgi:hypothetical protein
MREPEAGDHLHKQRGDANAFIATLEIQNDLCPTLA